MEYIIAIVITILLAASSSWLIKDMRKNYESRCFVYPKTGTIYHVDNIIKLKSPDTGEWHKAILYTDTVKNEIYTREYDDFFNKFIPLNKWRNGEGR